MEVAAVGWGISPYITRLLDKACSELKANTPREDLDNLVTHIFPQLTLTLQAAQGGAHKKKVLEALVKELKSAFEDTEDILDDLQYIQHDKHRSNSEERDEANQVVQAIGRLDMGGDSDQNALLEILMDPTKEAIDLPLSLFKRITTNFSDKIGEGGFGVVYEGLLGNGLKVAVKKLDGHKIDDAKFHTEINFMKKLNHKNIVRFLCYCVYTKKVIERTDDGEIVDAEKREWLLCFEYVSRGTIKEHIADESCGLEWPKRFQIIKGICDGLDYIHNVRKIAHLDIKPDNILLDENMVPKIGDFGVSRLAVEYSKRSTINSYGTLGYMAPEYVNFGKISRKADIFGLGRIIFELVTGSKGPEDHEKDYFLEKVLTNWSKVSSAPASGSIVMDQVKACMKIALMCTTNNADERPDITQILNMIHVIPQLECTAKELKSDLDATEDILDDIIEERKHKSSVLDSAGPSNQGIAVDHIPKDVRDRLVKNVKNIEELIDKAKTTLDIGNAAHIAIRQSNLGSRNRSAEHEENVTASAYATSSVTGRDEVRKQIIEKLHTEDVNPSSSDSTCLSAIGIWGIPGSGKTTLAKYIFDSEENGKYFDLVMLIHVSKSFTVHGIWKEMLEQAFEGDSSCPNYTSSAVLMRELKKLLTKKRILLVLDDIWFTENVHDCRIAEIISPLMVGMRGSKVLVTSRHENGVKLLGPDVIIIDNSPIPDLENKIFLELFMHHAFGKQRTDVPCRGSLMKIGTKIAQKLKKSPLLAVAVGGTLRNNQNEDYWRSVGEQEFLDNPNYMGRRLWWCYQHLNEQAKRCFAYCSVFPRRRRLYRDELVNLWVAQGFIISTGIGSNMESVGWDCFNELLSVGFLKPGGKDWNGKDYFVIHDLLYDIAEMVAGSDCFKIEDGMTKPPSEVRHLFIESCNASMITEDIIKLGNLRTLIIFNGEDDMTEQVFDKMFRKLTKLRVLIYQGLIKEVKSMIFLFPKSISELRYLRFLYFHTRPVMPKIRLPARLAKLYLLQVLDLGVNRGGSRKFDFSSVDMTNLINLRHLMNNGEVDFRNIGRLTSLQMIPPLEVRRGEGYGLEQLGNLNKLQGKLEIKGLESVKSKKEALAAKLADKERLTKLVLKWDSGRPTDVEADAQADVLEGLCPPEGLRYMRLHKYGGSRYPSWMVGPQKSTMQLQELELHHCYYKLPKTMNMEHLQSLSFNFLEWGDLPDDMSLLTSLKRLVIFGCRRLRRLPALPASLEYFKLSSCSEEFTRSCTTEGNHNWEAIKNIPNIHIRAGVFEPDRYVRGEERGGYRWGYL